MLTFNVGEQRMALPASMVREIAPLPRITRVPHAPDALLGVVNMRGTVVPVLAVSRLLGMADSSARRLIVVDVDGPVGLAVSSVSQVVEKSESASLQQLNATALIAQAVPRGHHRRAGGGIVAAREDGAQVAHTLPLLTCVVSGQYFAFPLAVVEEVLRLPDDIAIMPHSDAVVVGTVGSRDTLLPLLSLAALLALPVAPSSRQSRIVVIRIGAHRVGLVIDAVQSIARVRESDIDAVPDVLNRGGSEAHIKAICRLDEGARLLSVLAPDQLLRDDITARLLQTSLGEAQDMIDRTTEMAGDRFLIFRIGEERFGLPIDSVEEVASLPPRLTPLPKAPDFVLGVMNVRGNVIPVIDQARRFNGTPVVSAKPRVIVVRIGELWAGFIVDAVSEVTRIPESALRDAPDLGTQGTRVFERVANLGQDNSLVLIVSPQELLDRAEQDMLAVLGKKSATGGA